MTYIDPFYQAQDEASKELFAKTRWFRSQKRRAPKRLRNKNGNLDDAKVDAEIVYTLRSAGCRCQKTIVDRIVESRELRGRKRISPDELGAAIEAACGRLDADDATARAEAVCKWYEKTFPEAYLPSHPEYEARYDRETFAERFAEYHKDRDCFVLEDGKKGTPYVWTGKRYEPSASQFRSLIMDGMNLLSELGRVEELFPTKEMHSSFLKALRALRTTGTATTEAVQMRRELRVKPDKVDTDPWLLNTPRGVIDLKALGKSGDLHKCVLLSHDDARVRKAHLTSITKANFDPDAPDVFRKALEKSLDTAVELGDEISSCDYVMMYLGAGLHGTPLVKGALFLSGPANTGKSQTGLMIIKALGDYGAKSKMKILMHDTRGANDSTPEYYHAIKGRRMTFVEESGRLHELDMAFFKEITGGRHALVTARSNYGSSEELVPSSLIIATNQTATIDAADRAARARFIMAPTQAYKGKRPAPLDADKVSVRASVLKGLLQGWIQYCEQIESQRRELTDLEPAACRAAREQWVSESSQLSSFIDEYCIRAEGAFVTMEVLWLYFEWLRDKSPYPQALKNVGRIRRRRFEELISAEFKVDDRVTRGEQRDLRRLVIGLSPDTEIIEKAAMHIETRLRRRPREEGARLEGEARGKKTPSKEPKPFYKRFRDPMNGKSDEEWEEGPASLEQWTGRRREKGGAPLKAIRRGKVTGERNGRGRRRA